MSGKDHPTASVRDSGAGGPVDVLIIGAGFSGIGMGVRLQQERIKSFLIVERGADFGGTWRINTYPGCECDVPSHLYSFSFEKNPEWSRMYPTQPEIERYLRAVAEKHDLRKYTRFNTEVASAEFEEASGMWRVGFADGGTVNARFVVSCMGGLSRPQLPRIDGIDRFRGPSFHSANWEHEHDFTGRTVAVVGTGASAIQFVPHLARRAARVHLFQRTPPWILPKPDRAIRSFERAAFRWVPGVMTGFRWYLYWRQEFLGIGYTLKPGWLKLAEKLALRYLRKCVPDPELRRKLTPAYRIGCKRVLLTDDYLPALARSNVEVITEGVREVREGSIVSEDGRERPVDAIIYGTGFRTLDFTTPVRFKGPGGRDLATEWRERPRAYFGVAVAGFPNLFFITGPNSRVANNSIVFMIEAQVKYVVRWLVRSRDRALRSVVVKPEAQERFNGALVARARGTVFASGCKSWYLDEKGESPVLWPGFSSEYWWKSRRIDLRDFVTG